MPEYTCNRCRKYVTTKKTHMYNHVCKEKKCQIDLNCLNISYDQQIKFSLINFSNGKETDNIYYNENNYNCSKTTVEFIDELKEIYISKRTNCNHCNASFDKNKKLEKHLFNCIRIKNDNEIVNTQINIVNNTNNSNNTNIIENNSNNITINNNNNINNINNINNNNNININAESLIKNNIVIIPFNKDWITEHIDNETKTYLFLKNFNTRYTDTLEEIMKNDANKNILIDKDSNSGIVYNNDNLERMKIKDIVNDCVNKLQKHLIEFGTRIMDIEGINEQIIKSILKDHRYELHNYNNHKKDEFDFNNVLVESLNKVHEKTKTQMLKLINENDKIMN